jgi:ABC-type oligopeptide transport system substrate-binding subunit
MDSIVNAANAKPIDQVVSEYVKANKMLTDDVVWAPLVYGTQPYLVQSYVKGAGYNALYDYNWEGIRILQH